MNQGALKMVLIPYLHHHHHHVYYELTNRNCMHTKTTLNVNFKLYGWIRQLGDVIQLH